MQKAILSARPANAEPTGVPFIDLVQQYQTIKPEIDEAVQRVFESQAFVLGEEVATFEKEIASYCDSQHAIGCASGTDALILALMALDVGPGDEVITSPFSFFATASCITRLGATPVFVDIDPRTFNIDPSAVEAAITPNTKAMLPVHIFGQCAEMEPLWRLSTETGIPIVEDAAQAIGSGYRGRRAGVLGSIGCFSFFPTKNLGGAGDGGMITTDDDRLAARMKSLRVHGDAGGYNHLEVGLNSRLDALQAAVLSVKLKKLDEWSQSRQANANWYRELFDRYQLNDALTAPHVAADRDHIYNQFVVRVDASKRADIIQQMRAEKLGCAVYYPKPLHLQDCFSSLGYQPGQLPEAEKACEEVLALPIFAELTLGQLEQVVRGLAKAVGTLESPSNSTAPLRKAA